MNICDQATYGVCIVVFHTTAQGTVECGNLAAEKLEMWSLLNATFHLTAATPYNIYTVINV